MRVGVLRTEVTTLALITPPVHTHKVLGTNDRRSRRTRVRTHILALTVGENALALVVAGKVRNWHNARKATTVNLQRLILATETVLQVLHVRVEHGTLPWGSILTPVKVLPSLGVLLRLTLGRVTVLGKTHDAWFALLGKVVKNASMESWM